MNAEILSVGTELLLGNIANTDAQDISEMLSEIGINVYYHSVVGDNPERLIQAVEIAKNRADIIITTGGLGPTCDDLTKQTLVKAFGLEMYFDKESAEEIRDYFADCHRGRPMPENNLQQAYLPVGCTKFTNLWGTAPGCAFESGGVHVLMLPGPPRECRAMFAACAVPYLRALSGYHILSHNIHVFGSGESAVEEMLHDMMNSLTNPTLAPYAKEGEVMLRVTARAESHEKAEAMMKPVLGKVLDTLGDIVYGIDEDSFESMLAHMLEEHGATLSAAESCTGGRLAQRLTDIPGVSRVFKGGVTVYSNESKSVLLGIDPVLIAEKGAVSAEVAREMAVRVREKLGTTIGIGITGLAGPDGDGSDTPVGTVYVALAAEDGSVYLRRLHLGNVRLRLRNLAVNHAFDMVRRYLTGKKIEF